MDLGAGAKRVIVTKDYMIKPGESRIWRECTLPLIEQNSIDVIIKDLCVQHREGLGSPYRLVACAEGVAAETEAHILV